MVFLANLEGTEPAEKFVGQMFDLAVGNLSNWMGALAVVNPSHG